MVVLISNGDDGDLKRSSVVARSSVCIASVRALTINLQQ